MPVVVVVPARGGSKGIPGKNLRPAGGLTLTARAVLAGRAFLLAAGLRDGRVVVDTDSEAIADEGRRFGAWVPFLRPAALAADDTPTTTSVLHCIDRLNDAGFAADAIVLLQPTSPLRHADDITACWRAYDAARVPQVVAVTALEHPIELAVRMDAGGVLSWAGSPGVESARRQEFSPAFRISGAVYVSSVAALRSTGTFLTAGVARGVAMPAERSIDVDTAADLIAADAIARQPAPTPSLTIGNKKLGGGAPCFVIAEAGVNHNGDPELAHRLIDVAANAGADAVKFQTFDPDLLAAPDAGQAAYQSTNTGVIEPQLEMLRRLVLPTEVYEALKQHAEARGMEFLSTAFDEGSADFLHTLGMVAFKIPSGDITNLPLIAHVARKGKPMLISSGMASMAEVAEAVMTVRASGSPPLALFHCITNYPAAPEQCNLASMASMRAAFGVPVGWSDHTEGRDISVAAAALGAELIEKHFTLDRTLPGPDQKASLEPDELTALIRAVRDVDKARGTGEKAPVAVEHDFAALVRKSLRARRPLHAGHVLAAEDVIALRPGDGLPPSALPALIGRALRGDVAAGARLSDRDFA